MQPMPSRTFGNVMEELERIGPIGSQMWFYSWSKLHSWTSLTVPHIAPEIDPCDLADWMQEISADWWAEELHGMFTGKRCSRAPWQMGYAPAMPNDPEVIDETGRTIVSAAVVNAVDNALGGKTADENED